MNKSINCERVNFTLSQEIISLINKIAPKGERSHLISDAVRFYAQEVSKKKIRQALKEVGQARSENDLVVAKEWFSLEEEI